MGLIVLFCVFFIVIGMLYSAGYSIMHNEEIQKEEKSMREKILNEIKNITNNNISVLARKYKQKVFENDYGKTILKDWWKEEEYFVNEMIIPELILKFNDNFIIKKNKNLHDITVISKKNSFWTIMVDVYSIMHEEFFKNYNTNQPNITFQDKVITGIDYENYIEKYFQDKGYSVKRTPKSGDQGVDLVAEKNNQKIAIQCKFYKHPVGNKAVQEVVAGKKFYDCNHAMVITNASFTKSAKVLAKNTDVELLTILVENNVKEFSKKDNSVSQKKKNYNLSISKEIEANGGEVLFQLSEGKTVKIKIPKGVNNGDILRLSGLDENGQDLFITIKNN